MEGTLAEIRMFAGNFAPRGWMMCNGQLLAISQWTAVFALVGTIYGGNGQTTFGLPDFRGRTALGTGNGAGLPSVQLGEMSGTPTTTLLSINLPPHNHQLNGNLTIPAADDNTTFDNPAGNIFGATASPAYAAPAAGNVTMAPITLNLPTTVAGGNAPINTMPPYLGMNYIFCVEGIFPSRN
jgi:microcystin-dependent protein